MNTQPSSKSQPRSADQLLKIFYSGTKGIIADLCFDGIKELAEIVNSYWLPSSLLGAKLLPPFPVATQIIEQQNFSHEELRILLEQIYSPKMYNMMFGKEKPSFAIIPVKLRQLVTQQRLPSGSTLAYADLKETKLEDLSFSGNLQHVNLSRSKLRNLHFSSADMRCIDLSDAFTHDVIFQNTNMYGINLTRARLIGASCYRVDLTDAIMIGSNCLAMNFAGGANMTGANATGANFKNTIYEKYARYICCEQVNPLAIFIELLKQGLCHRPSITKIPAAQLQEMKSFLNEEKNYANKSAPAAIAVFLALINKSGEKLEPQGFIHKVCEACLCLSGNDDPRSFICENAGLSKQIWVQDYGMSYSFQTLFDFQEEQRRDVLRLLPASVAFSSQQLPAPSPAIRQVARASQNTEVKEERLDSLFD
jgi:hypothetical protein